MKARLGLVASCLGVLLLAAWLQGPVPGATGRYSERRIMMGTLVTLTLVGAPDAAAARDAAEEAFTAVAATERLYSTYMADSPLVRARQAGEELPPRLLAGLAEALEIHRLSGGWYDPTLGALVDLWGFGPDGAISRPPPEEAVARALAARCGDELRLGDGALSLPEGCGCRLDPSGWAKGAAVDRAVEVLAARGVAALVDAGGDLACTGPKPDGSPWRIGDRHPTRSEGLLGVLELSEGAVATSGDYERYFEFQGERYHHLLSPRTGLPGRLHVQSTVRAPTCREADAWATALFLAPTEEGLAMARRSGLEALVVTAEGKERRTAGFRWADEEGPGREGATR